MNSEEYFVDFALSNINLEYDFLLKMITMFTLKTNFAYFTKSATNIK